MTDNSRPVDDGVATEEQRLIHAGIIQFPTTPGAEKHAAEIALLAEVGEIVRQAMSEFRNDHPTAGRLCSAQAARRLHVVASGESV